MAKTATPALPQNAYTATALLAANTACTTRAPVATANLVASGLVALTAASTNDLRIDSIQIQACSSAIGATSAAQVVQIWIWDAASGFAYLIDEIIIGALVPSATAIAFTFEKFYQNPRLIPAAKLLYISSTIANTPSTTALQVTAYGGAF